MYVLNLFLISVISRQQMRILANHISLLTYLFFVHRSDIPCNLETKVCETTDSTVGDIVNYSRLFDKDILVSGTNARLNDDLRLLL